MCFSAQFPHCHRPPPHFLNSFFHVAQFFQNRPKTLRNSQKHHSSHKSKLTMPPSTPDAKTTPDLTQQQETAPPKTQSCFSTTPLSQSTTRTCPSTSPTTILQTSPLSSLQRLQTYEQSGISRSTAPAFFPHENHVRPPEPPATTYEPSSSSATPRTSPSARLFQIGRISHSAPL